MPYFEQSCGQVNLLEPIIVDSFAGGGGASVGIELATGRIVDIAINHDPDAILMHRANHPHTQHFQASVWDVDPKEVCRGREVGLLWASPDCKHFSKAKGGKPVSKNIRGLAWIVLRWAGTVHPQVIILENVEEFQTWGPVRRGRPVKSKTGQTFRKFVSQLESLGYAVEWRELVAADYGAPTTRKRFFLIARRDGKPIVWPAPTHAPADSPEVKAGRLKPWRSAAEIIDWSLPTPSIFDSRAEIKAKYGLNAQRPLRPNTMRRVARGIDKFVLHTPRPYLVMVNHAGEFRGQEVDSPLHTITAKHGYGVASPMMAPWTVTNTTNSTGHTPNEPVDTARTGGGGGQMFLSATLAAIGQTGGGDRTRDIREPTHTTVSKQEDCLVEASLIQYHTNVRGQELGGPLLPVDASNSYGLSAANLVKYYGSAQHGQEISGPLHTVTAKDKEGLTVASLSKYFGRVVGAEMSRPLPTATPVDHNALQTARLIKLKGENLGGPAEAPVQTVTAGGTHFGLVTTKVVRASKEEDLQRWPQVRTCLNAYCGYHLRDDEVILFRIGEAWYFIADVGLRMLTPRELYRANGFPDDYIIDRDYTGKEYGKSKQVARCGNAVPPPFATALVRANLPEWCGETITSMEQLERKVAI